MFRQGDQERALRLPVSPLMDRSKSGITKSQGKGSLLRHKRRDRLPTALLLMRPRQVGYHISDRVGAEACTAPCQALPAALQIAAHLQLVSASHISKMDWPSSTR